MDHNLINDKMNALSLDDTTVLVGHHDVMEMIINFVNTNKLSVESIEYIYAEIYRKCGISEFKDKRIKINKFQLLYDESAVNNVLNTINISKFKTSGDNYHNCEYGYSTS